MKSTRMTRRSMLGGVLTAGAVAALPEGIAHASTNDPFSNPSTGGASSTPLSAATPGLHYDRFSAVSFVPARPALSAYFSEPGSIRHTSATAEYFLCPFRPSHLSTLKELEFYIDTGISAAVVRLVRLQPGGTVDTMSQTIVPVSPTTQTVTVPVSHVVDLINFDYQLWATFVQTGTLWGARVGSIAPTSLVTVPQNRKLDTRSGARPAVGSITTVDLAPDVPLGAHSALVTITATGTVNGGFVSAFAGDQVTVPNTSALNWTVSDIDIATTSVVDLGAGTSIKLAIGGPASAATHLLVDVIGYFI